MLPHPRTPIHSLFTLILMSLLESLHEEISCHLLLPLSHRWRMGKNIWRNEHLSVIFNADIEQSVCHSVSNKVWFAERDNEVATI